MTDNETSVTTVVGIDLSTERGTTEIACLSLASSGNPPLFDPARHRSVVTDKDIIETIVSYRPSVVAIDAPLSLPAPVMHSLTTLGPHESEHGHERASSGSEHSARMPALSVSPYLRAAERDPIWSHLGVRPFPVSFLGGLTFRAIALLPSLRAELPGVPIIEVFPTGSARALGLHMHASVTSPRQKRQAKTSSQARSALQQALSNHISGVPTTSESEVEPLGADLLDALLAALTAAAYLRRAYVAIGNPGEGQIVLPWT